MSLNCHTLFLRIPPPPRRGVALCRAQARGNTRVSPRGILRCRKDAFPRTSTLRGSCLSIVRRRRAAPRRRPESRGSGKTSIRIHDLAGLRRRNVTSSRGTAFLESTGATCVSAWTTRVTCCSLESAAVTGVVIRFLLKMRYVIDTALFVRDCYSRRFIGGS